MENIKFVKRNWQWRQYTWLTTTANVCHLDRPRGSEATECEWRDPEDAYMATPIQGVRPRDCPRKRISRIRQKDSTRQLGENTSYRHGRGRILGISPLPFGPLRQAQGPSESVEMTDIGSSGEPSILTPLYSQCFQMVRLFETRFAGFSDHPIPLCPLWFKLFLGFTTEDTEN